MDRVLLTGSRHSELEHQAFQRAHKRATDSIGSILYITRNDARRSHVEDTWAESHRPLRLRAETLDAVVREWYEEIEGPVQTTSGQLHRRLTEYALDATTADSDTLLAGEPASAALADAFSSRFSLFDDAGVVTAEDLAAEFEESSLDERIATATVDAYRNYLALHQDHTEQWVRTRGEIFQTVATTDHQLRNLSPELDVVILSGFYAFRPSEQAILERIVDAFPTIAILPLHQDGKSGVDAVTADALETYEELGFEQVENEPVGKPATTFAAITNALYRPEPEEVSLPDSLRWRELPTPEREVRFVARELRTELAKGRPPDDLAVVIPGADAYAGYVEDTFATFDIPYATTAATTLNRTFTGSLVHDLLGLAEPTPRSEDLTSLLANPLTDIVTADQADAITAAARRRDTIALEPLFQDLEPAAKTRIEKLLTQLEILRSGNVTDATETLRQILEEQFNLETAVEDYAGGTEQAVEQRAYDLVQEVLDSFESMDAASSPLSPLALYTRAFDGIPLRVPQGTAGGHVEVMGMLDARMRSFEKVFIVGLTSEQFPVKPERPAFFEAMTEAHPRFDTADERLRGRYLFATLLANVDEATLTTPETGDGESAVVQSPVLDELQRVTGIEPIDGVDDRVGSREDLQRHVATAHDSRAAINHAGDRGDLSPEQTKRTDRGLACAEHRSTTEFTRHDGILDAETVAKVYPPEEREPYSASRIERYVECGFKFFAENILEIEDSDDVEVTPTPLETGSYVHDVLERFYAELQSDIDDEFDITTFDRQELEQHLLEIALDELSKTDFDYEGLFYERWLAELFAGLGDEATNPYANTKRPSEATERGLFARFLDEELSRNSDSQPRWFEKPFGEGLPDSDGKSFEVERPDGSTVPIRGYIDRVDVAGGGEQPRLNLYDYKTGKAPWMTQTTGGTKFQLPIYLLAADSVLDEEIANEAHLSATYYQVRPPNDVKVPNGVESKFESQTELRTFLNEVVPEWLGQIDEAIANGRFQTTVLPARGANCRYCDYRRACDVRHHRKREHIEEALSDDVTYVPLRVQDDEDLEAVMGDD